MKATVKIGWTLIAIALVFVTIETAYFGFNWNACCRAEEICDEISMGISVIGYILIFWGKR